MKLALGYNQNGIPSHVAWLGRSFGALSRWCLLNLSQQWWCAVGKQDGGGQIGSRLGGWPALPPLARA